MNSRVILAVVIAVVSVLAGATTQLDPVVGHTAALAISSVCNLLTAILAAVMGVLSTQTNQVAAVQAMPGVSRVMVNAQATPTLAAMVADSANPKIQAEPGQERKVAELANQ